MTNEFGLDLPLEGYWFLLDSYMLACLLVSLSFFYHIILLSCHYIRYHCGVFIDESADQNKKQFNFDTFCTCNKNKMHNSMAFIIVIT